MASAQNENIPIQNNTDQLKQQLTSALQKATPADAMGFFKYMVNTMDWTDTVKGAMIKSIKGEDETSWKKHIYNEVVKLWISHTQNTEQVIFLNKAFSSIGTKQPRPKLMDEEQFDTPPPTTEELKQRRVLGAGDAIPFSLEDTPDPDDDGRKAVGPEITNQLPQRRSRSAPPKKESPSELRTPDVSPILGKNAQRRQKIINEALAKYGGQNFERFSIWLNAQSDEMIFSGKTFTNVFAASNRYNPDLVHTLATSSAAASSGSSVSTAPQPTTLLQASSKAQTHIPVPKAWGAPQPTVAFAPAPAPAPKVAAAPVPTVAVATRLQNEADEVELQRATSVDVRKKVPHVNTKSSMPDSEMLQKIRHVMQVGNKTDEKLKRQQLTKSKYTPESMQSKLRYLFSKNKNPTKSDLTMKWD
jgi:hypothetical protein